MNKAKIYKPTKTAMQSGIAKTKHWVLEYIVEKTGINPLMGWESSTDTYSELKLEFSSKKISVLGFNSNGRRNAFNASIISAAGIGSFKNI